MTGFMALATPRGRGNKGATMIETVEKANRARVALLSNKLLDSMLVKTSDKGKPVKAWEGLDRGVKRTFPVWSGTLWVYTMPDEAFGNEVVCTDPESKVNYIFPVPGALRGVRNALLAIDHEIKDGKPTFEIHQNGKGKVIDVPNPDNIRIYEDFPKTHGWYKVNSHVVPFGRKLSWWKGRKDPNARYLYRAGRMSTGFTVLVARGPWGYDGNCGAERDLIASYWPTLRLGALAQEQER